MNAGRKRPVQVRIAHIEGAAPFAYVPPQDSSELRGIDQFRDALGDYYDSGAIGDPPKREDYPA